MKFISDIKWLSLITETYFEGLDAHARVVRDLPPLVSLGGPRPPQARSRSYGGVPRPRPSVTP
jgi:hypothetical protein